MCDFAGSIFRWIQKQDGPRRYINVEHCRGLSIVLLQLIDPLDLFVKRMEFLAGSSFYLVAIRPLLLKAT